MFLLVLLFLMLKCELFVYNFCYEDNVRLIEKVVQFLLEKQNFDDKV